MDLLLCALTLILSYVYTFLALPMAQILVSYFVLYVIRLSFTMARKLRIEVFNEDLKISKPHEVDSNKYILITGATSGIGLANALYFHSLGFNIIACYYNQQEVGFERLETLSKDSVKRQKINLVRLNVRSEESIALCFEEVSKILANSDGKLHAIINVAGVAFCHKAHFMPRAYTRTMVETNLLGPMMMVRQFLPLLIKCPGSRIINVGSVVAWFPAVFGATYCATKIGTASYSNCLNLDLANFDIHIVTVHPGNLLNNTAILARSLKTGLETIENELSEEEREVYKGELELHRAELERVRRNCEKPIDLTLSWDNPLLINLKRFFMLICGGESSKELHQTGLMRSFDNAVRLRNPPKEMFAANIIHDIFTGASFSILSHSTRRDSALFLARYNLNPSQICTEG